jgi:hypothetical protein
MVGNKPKKPHYVLAAIIVVAVLLRIGAAFYLGDTLFTAQQDRVYDQISYNALAQSLLAGKGYTFSHDWYPGFTPANTPTAHWSFLYPLYLTLVYLVAGVHPLAARLLQAVIMGVLKTWLIYRLGRSLFGEVVGLVAAGLSAVYFYFIFYDAALMTEPFFMCAVLGLLLLGLRMTGMAKDGPSQTPGWRWWVLLGGIAGAAALLRQTILFWLPLQLVWMLWASSKSYPRARDNTGDGQSTQARPAAMRDRWKKPVWGSLLSLSVVSLIILPWTIRNYIVYGGFLPLNSNAGFALYSANHPDHGVNFMPIYAAPLPEDMLGKAQNEADWNSALTRRGLEFALQDPQRYLRLTLSKAAVQFKFWFEADATWDSNLMRLLSFGLYLPFFIAGLALSLRDWRRSTLIYLFVVAFNLLHILTWPGIRYRLPVDAALMPYAALAVVALVELISIRISQNKPRKEDRR